MSQCQVPVRSVDHLVPTRNLHVEKASRNKAQCGAVPSWHHKCWSAVRTQNNLQGALKVLEQMKETELMQTINNNKLIPDNVEGIKQQLLP